jgi:glutathione S-transferase
MNKAVSRSEFFCGDELTAADIVIYHELKTVLVLYKKQIASNETPDLFAWYSRVQRIEVIIKMDEMFVSIVKKYQFV